MEILIIEAEWGPKQINLTEVLTRLAPHIPSLDIFHIFFRGRWTTREACILSALGPPKPV